MSADEIIEIVLPSGKFATIRPLAGTDYLIAKKASDNGLDLMFSLICVAVRIDDKALLYTDLLQMDLRDIMSIQKALNPFIDGPVKVRQKFVPKSGPQ
jgi:hypothetical protein